MSAREPILLSFIVPTYNEEKNLPRLLASIKYCCDKFGIPHEIIVVDDKSADATIMIAQAFNAKIILNDRRMGEYPSRNLGALVAKGEYLIFTGADVIIPCDTLYRVISSLKEDKRLAGMYVRTYPHDGSLVAKLEFVTWYTLTTLWYYISGEANASAAFFAIKRSAFLTTKGFEDVAYADSMLSRELSKKFKIRPCFKHVVYVSGRRIREMGLKEFNKLHTVMFLDIFFPFLRKSKYLVILKKYLKKHVHDRISSTVYA